MALREGLIEFAFPYGSAPPRRGGLYQMDLRPAEESVRSLTPAFTAL
jgi:hypothetical protein